MKVVRVESESVKKSNRRGKLWHTKRKLLKQLSMI